MDVEKEFQTAVEQVNNLPAATAAAHMTELYGLYKQATDGDVNMGTDEVDADGADKASGPAGLSQAQWESWNQFKGLSEEEAKRRYVTKAREVTGPQGTAVGTTNNAQGDQPAMEEDTDYTSTSQQPAGGPGVSEGGLQGDITAGAPYGGEDLLKGAQSA